MSKTEAYSWIGVIIGCIVGLVMAVVLEGCAGVDIMVILNCSIFGAIVGRYDNSRDCYSFIPLCGFFGVIAIICAILGHLGDSIFTYIGIGLLIVAVGSIVIVIAVLFGGVPSAVCNFFCEFWRFYWRYFYCS